MGMRLPCLVVVTGLLLSRSALAEEPRPPAHSERPRPARADDPTCTVDRFVGVSEDDAEAVQEIICTELRSQVPYGGRYHVRIAKLGGKVVLTIVGDKSDGGHVEKQLVLSGLEEVPVAAPRLVEAVVEQKHVVETQTVTNVVGEEARTPKKKASEVHGWLGMVGAATTTGQGAGVHFGFSAGSDRWSFVGDVRAAGSAFTAPTAVALTIASLGLLEPEPEDKFGYASLAGGVRHHFSSRDTSVFVGGGIALDYVNHTRKGDGVIGMAAYAEVGVDLLRTHAVGGAIALRVDAPAFTMEERKDLPGPSWQYNGTATVTSYTPVVGGGVSLRF
jgi:hypothetical protein